MWGARLSEHWRSLKPEAGSTAVEGQLPRGRIFWGNYWRERVGCCKLLGMLTVMNPVLPAPLKGPEHKFCINPLHSHPHQPLAIASDPLQARSPW